MSENESGPGRPSASDTSRSAGKPTVPDQSSKADVPEPNSSGAGEDKTQISTLPPIATSPTLSGLSTAELARVLEGRKLGHIRLEHFIGGGGMGAVFRGVDTELHRTVAVKVLSPRQYADEETLKRFKVEAQSAARLDHENIARVYYVGEDQGVHYIVFEYIDGINIRDLVRRQGPMPIPDAIAITLQIADALAHSYRRNVVHRDIKPSNVLMTSGARAKLVDMGLARVHQQEQSDEELTASGVTLGTFDYISPEQARDPREADVRSDLYSLGCTSFFMLTGQPPFPEGTVLQKLLRHQGDEAPDPRQLRPEIPDPLAVILAKMLAKAPAQRYQQPDELMADLLPLARRYGLPTFDLEQAVWSRVVPSPEPFWRRQLPWLVPCLLLLAGAAVLEWTSLPAAFMPAVEPARTGATALPAPDPPVGIGTSSRSEGTTGDATSPDGREPVEPPEPGVGTANEGRGQPARDHPSDAAFGEPSDDDGAGRGNQGLRPGRSAGTTRSDGDGSEAERAGPAPGESASSDQTIGAGGRNRGVDRVGAKQPSAPNRPPGAADPIVVVGQQPGQGERTFASLRAAVEAAHSGDVIELRFDGPRQMRPVRISNKRLTIRASQGAAPVLLFDATAVRGDPSPRVPGMITLLGGHLTLVNLDIRATGPSVTDSVPVSLFKTSSAESLHMDRCRLSLPDADGTTAASFVNVRAALDDQADAPGQQPSNGPLRLGVRLEDCIAIGDGAFVRLHDSPSIDLSWNNGLFVSGQHLLDVQQQRDAASPQSISIDVQHLTACTGGELIVARGLAGGPDPLVECVFSDSILVRHGDGPLVVLGGAMPMDALQAMFVWRGDRNCYEKIAAFWRIESSSGQSPRELDFDQWREYWAGMLHGHDHAGHLNSAVWKQPLPAGQPLGTSTHDNFVLDDRVADQPALRGAADGGPVGFRRRSESTERAPPSPVDSSAPSPQPDDPAR